MWQGVVAAIIAGVFAVISNLIISHKSSKEMYAELDKAQAVTNTKIDELTREVREHNGFAKRVPVLEKQMENVEKRLERLEEKG